MTATPADVTTLSAPVRVPVALARALAGAMPRAEYLDWVLWAWGILAQAGEGAADLSEWAEVDDVIGLAALAQSLSNFADILSGSADADGDYPDLLGGRDTWVTDLALGRYCERHDIHTGDEPESSGELLKLAIREQEPRVRDQLMRLIGDAQLYASMRQAVESDVELADEADDEPYRRAPGAPGLWADKRAGLARNLWQPDLSDDALRGAGNSGLTTQHGAAFEWLSHG